VLTITARSVEGLRACDPRDYRLMLRQTGQRQVDVATQLRAAARIMGRG
jgi:hypothetical protein